MPSARGKLAIAPDGCNGLFDIIFLQKEKDLSPNLL